MGPEIHQRYAFAILAELKEGEIVESVSLGAGNTGRKFDFETNFRVAECKFIDWQGGAEAIRQHGIFKEFFELAEYLKRVKVQFKQ